MRSVDLFGLIVSIQMLANIGLFLHNRHLAATVRELSAAVDRLRKDEAGEADGRGAASGPAAATIDQASGRRAAHPGRPFSWLFR